MKIGIAGDLHGHNFELFSHKVDGFNDRLLDTISVIDQIRDICNDREVDKLYFLGDIFHARYRIHTDVYTEIFNGIKEITKSIPDTVFIVGNHDLFLKNPDRVNSLMPLSELGEVVTRPQVTHFPPSKDFFVISLPYKTTYERGEIKDFIEEKISLVCGKRNHRHILILGHLEVAGLTMPSGYKTRKGINLEEEILSAFKGKKYKSLKIMLGHYHHPKTVCKGKVIFTGSSMHINRLDTTTIKDVGDRYFHIWEDGEVEAIPLQFPKFIKDTWKNIEKRTWNKAFSNDFITVLLNEKDNKKPEEVKKYLFEQRARAVEVIYKPTIETEEISIIENYDPGITTEQAIAKYIEDQAPEELDEEFLVSKAKEIINNEDN